jgi:hypothetical protein
MLDINLLSCLLSLYIGMMGLNLSMQKPFQEIFKRHLSTKTCYGLRIVAWSFLTVSLVCSMQTWNIGIGIVAWLGLATAVVGMLVLLQAYHLKKAWWLTWGALIALLGMQCFRWI